MSAIHGKVIAFIGATSAVGAAAAQKLAERGAHVMLGARRGERLAELAAAIGDAGGSARYLALDVTDPRSTQRFISTAHAWFGRLDVVINNACVSAAAPSRLAALQLDDWNRLIDVNLRGVLHGIAASLPLMQAQGHGQLVTVCAAGDRAGAAACAVQGATRAAVEALSQGLRQEVGSALRVDVIASADAVACAIVRAVGAPMPMGVDARAHRPRAQFGENGDRPRSSGITFEMRL